MKKYLFKKLKKTNEIMNYPKQQSSYISYKKSFTKI